MPVQLPTFNRSTVDPAVARALKDLADAVNALEQKLPAALATDPQLANQIAAMRQVTARVDNLLQRVQALGG